MKNKPFILRTAKSDITGTAINFAINAIHGHLKELGKEIQESVMAFVDMRLTETTYFLVEHLISQGCRIIYIDHHPPVKRMYRKLKALTANSRHYVWIDGKYAAASRMVSLGLWETEHVDVVLMHNDLDGLTCYWRGLGLSYPEMLDDISLVDRPHFSRSGKQLSYRGELMLAMISRASSNCKGLPIDLAFAEGYFFTRWEQFLATGGDLSNKELSTFVQVLEAANREGEYTAHWLLHQQTDIDGHFAKSDIVFRHYTRDLHPHEAFSLDLSPAHLEQCDAEEVEQMGGFCNVKLSLWKRLVWKQHPRLVILVRDLDANGNEVGKVFVPKTLRRSLTLDDLLRGKASFVKPNYACFSWNIHEDVMDVIREQISKQL